MKRLRPLAFVLPQFHPIPENDKWWGTGFTEWTNVGKAKPLFEGHYQPKLPTELGYYDLRLPESRAQQAALAKSHGIHGFCYYHYWFNGKRLLNRPIDDILALKEPDMPFMLCWANENWTRRWDGLDQEVLMEQKYSEQDDIDHMRWLCANVFSDKRYITIEEQPVFMIYRQDLFPDMKKTAAIWRKVAVEEFGFKGLYLCTAESFNKRIDPEQIGFDAAVEFAPHAILKYPVEQAQKRKGLFGKKKPLLNLRDFKKGATECMQRQERDFKLFRCVTPAWDNSARKGDRGHIAIGSSPQFYEQWLTEVAEKFEPFSEEENLIFINAMNEWAEGNYLEPCQVYGRAYLEATKNALTPFVNWNQ